MDKTNHIEVIESSRPGSQDLSDFPETERAIQQDNELRAFAHYVADTDQRLSRLMSAVEVPEGLAERLQAAVQSAAQPTVQTHLPRRRARIELPASVRPLSRRQWTSLAAGLALSAAGIFMAASFSLRHWYAVDIDKLVTAYDEADKQLAGGAPFSAAVMHAGYRLPKQNLVAIPLRWQQVRTSVDSTTQVVSLDGNALMLIVKARYASSLPNSPLDEIHERTGGKTFTAWSENGLVFLVAANDRDALRKIFPSAPPIAVYRPAPANSRRPV